jgi:flagellar motor switch protein FliN/FliY
MAANQTADGTRQSFSSAFAGALVAAIAEATGAPWLTAAVPDAGSASDNSEPVRMKLALDGSLTGEFLLQFHRAEAAALASKLLRQPADEFGAEQTEALLKLIEAAVGNFRFAVEPGYGAFAIKTSSASEPLSGAANAVEFTAVDNDGNRVSFSIYLNAALTQALLLHSQAQSLATDTGKSMNTDTENEISEQVNLNLVMDVELSVTLRFGQRQLTLREVMELTSGSVVELDRQVEEPVELLLNGVVIARGEAVVIDGNYGLRVTEVSQPIAQAALR